MHKSFLETSGLHKKHPSKHVIVARDGMLAGTGPIHVNESSMQDQQVPLKTILLLL